MGGSVTPNTPETGERLQQAFDAIDATDWLPNDLWQSIPVYMRRAIHNHHLDALIDAPAPANGKSVIVPLRWSEPDPTASYPEWVARVSAMQFVARIDTSRALCFGKFPLSINSVGVEEKFDTLEDAKAHAENVYHERVAELLDPAALSAPSPASGEAMREVDEDWFAEVIADSIDMDWSPAVGAKAIIRELAKLNAPPTDEQEAERPRCGCTSEVARRVIINHGTCGMAGCPYGGDR